MLKKKIGKLKGIADGKTLGGIMCVKARTILIFLSYLAVVNVTCIPLFGDEYGLLAEDFQPRFVEVVEKVFQSEPYKEQTGDQITITLFIPTMLMCLASVFGKRTMFEAACKLGIVVWVFIMGRLILSYSLYEDGFYRLFDAEQGDVSIGIWIAIVLFSISYWISRYFVKKENTLRQRR